MDLGNRIQTLRRQQGLSQEALAQQLGVSRQAIGKWETGATLPSIDNLLELSAILGTTVDYLLTGRESEPPDTVLSPDTAPDQTISMEALRALLAEQQAQPPRKRWRRRLPAAAGILFLLLLVGLLGHYITRLSTLEHTVSNLHSSVDLLDGQMQNALHAIQSGIQESLDQEASILSAWDCGFGDYDPVTQTATVQMSATPKTLTEDTAVRFVLSPMVSSQDTLPQTITAEGHIPTTDGLSSGVFTAEVPVPMVQDFLVSVLLIQDGIQQTETVSEQYGFSSRYVCTMSAWANSFTWSYSSGSEQITVSGYPSITVASAAMDSAPKPETLLCELYIDGTLVESDEIDAYKAFYAPRDATTNGDIAEVASSEITFYPTPQDTRSYSRTADSNSDPAICWKFTLTDTAGNEYTDEIQW